MVKKAQNVEVAIVGAGFSGMCAGIKLREAGIDDFVILERAGDVGGCWRDNTYPGIAVDINSFSYSFSFEPNPEWTRTFARGPELKAYADRLTEKYRLREKIRFHSQVDAAEFDEGTDRWQLRLGSGSKVTARFLVAAGGVLTDPKYPDIPGVESFAGQTVHTARWDHRIDLDGKRVAVIGTGASAVQLVPSIAPQVERLYVHQRTPIWVLPRPDVPIPPLVRTVFRRLPPAQYTVRALSGTLSEAVLTFGAIYNKQLPWAARTVEAAGRAYLRTQVRDRKLREKLTPHYGFACKRPVVSSDYLRTFNRDNVELVSETIDGITPSGIRTADGVLRDIDVLVLATGFRVFDKGNVPGFTTVGRDGLELGDFWHRNRYQAYEGITVPSFPNFFLTFGPYSLGGSSYLATTETHVRHAVRVITEARRRGAAAVEVRQEPHDRYFRSVLRKMQNSVFFNNHCESSNSYYFDHHGDAPGLRPATGLEMWWRSGHFDLDDYEYRMAADVG